MSEAHCIIRHTLVAGNGEILGDKTCTPGDKPVSVFELAAGKDPA